MEIVEWVCFFICFWLLGDLEGWRFSGSLVSFQSRWYATSLIFLLLLLLPSRWYVLISFRGFDARVFYWVDIGGRPNSAEEILQCLMLFLSIYWIGIRLSSCVQMHIGICFHPIAFLVTRVELWERVDAYFAASVINVSFFLFLFWAIRYCGIIWKLILIRNQQIEE